MYFILFDDETRFRLLPFTHTRPVADIRCGIFSMRERWEHFTGEKTGTLAAPYLQQVFSFREEADAVFVNGAVFASATVFEAVSQLQEGEKLLHNDMVIAAKTGNSIKDIASFQESLHLLKPVTFEGKLLKLDHVWDIFSLNDEALKEDFSLITNSRKSAALPENIIVSGSENIFLEEGAMIHPGSIINATTGPVYLAKDAEVLEGCMLRGPIALGEHAVVKMGAKIYGATTIGPGCKVGGEISNVVFFANSNKGHDGYLGNAVIGEWCNLGADTNCSNLKNNYDQVKIWDEHTNRPIRTGLQFCGLIMGDHSKCGINTMFNTGTVVGVSANIFGGDFQEKFIASFSWGGPRESETYNFNKAMDTAGRMMARRGKKFSEQELAMYRQVFDSTAAQRAFWNTKKDSAAQ